MLNRETKRKILFDAILVLLLLAISLSVYFVFLHNREDGSFVRVSINGDAVAEYPLYINAEYTLNGGTNILRIEDGCAYMLSADCPKQMCVNKGRVYMVGDSIDCMHNRIRVEVIGG